MNDLKNSITTLISQIEDKLSTYSQLTKESEKKNERQLIESLITKTEDEYSIFEKQLNKTKIGRQAYLQSAECFETKLSSIKNQYEQLKNEINKRFAIEPEYIVTPGVETPLANRSNMLKNKKMIGDSELNKGKEKLESIRVGLVRINDEITSVEEEIELQREKLIRVKGKVSESHSIVKQTKIVMNKISRMLYHDTLLKVLIVFILLAIITIIILSLVLKVQKYRMKAYDENYADIQKAINYADIDENYFMNMYNEAVDHVSVIWLDSSLF